ncbi:26S proteasome non-ATPase regulatory subunit 5-like [Ctenocephalides felis]|uniref:26S proteasome non-ATPase regulatory subunit 5-like n=1 Tax=Ctenocephalides felis TaxID=7515 RepID=UPI000E6E43B5|nr:26S proteasome non-ATPase regulatory subunit 5-like [Ctenocephalides felis]
MALFKYQENLMNQDTRTEALNDIKQQLVSARGTDIAEYAHSIKIPLLFECLENDENEEQIDLACEILTICMENLSLGESLVKYPGSLEKSLTHKYDIVRQMSLKEVMFSKESLIAKIVDCVGHDNLSVAHVAVNILCLIIMPWISNHQILSGLQNVMNRGEIQRFRVYEILIQLATKSKDNFNKIESTSFLAKMLSELDLKDELVQLNVIELLTQLAMSDHGFNYLENKGIFKHFAVQVENIDQNPLSPLILPGLLKFFGRVAHTRPTSMLTQYKNILSKIFDIVQNSYDDETLLLVSLDTIGYLGATRDGKFALNNNVYENMVATLKKIGFYIHSGSTEIRIRALDCLKHLVEIDPSDTNNEIQSITQKWFNTLCENPVDFIFNVCRKPFPDIKLAALGILKVIACQLWGADLIVNNPGIIEYLLDRRTENFKDGKQAKFDIIFALNQIPDLDLELRQRLQLYIAEGPFYVEAVTDIAIEGE